MIWSIQAISKKAIGDLIDVVYRHAGQKATVIFCDKIMGLGFREACNAGISFGKDDMIIPAREENSRGRDASRCV